MAADPACHEAGCPPSLADQRRWLALATLCLGFLMTSINGTVLTIALPSITRDLQFSETSLVWIVNAYLCAFAGCLLLGGRLGDLFGHRRVFLLGICLFALASVACGIARSAEWFIAARAMQGVGGAVVSTVARALLINLFDDPPRRAKAMGICSFVGASGGSLGLLLGGALTSLLTWRWIFVANALIGAIAYALCLTWVPRDTSQQNANRLDIPGAITASIALVLASYAIANGNFAGWASLRTLGILSAAGVLAIIFVRIEARARVPLAPPSLFRMRHVVVANVAGALMAAAVLAWNVILGLYLQRVLQLSPLQAGVMFLPANVLIGAMSLLAAPRLVVRFGSQRTLIVGLLTISAGLAQLAEAQAAGTILELLPGMLLIGTGAGMTYSPIVLVAFHGVPQEDSGAASGIMNTSFAVGGALGLAVLISAASARTSEAMASGAKPLLALAIGYQTALGMSSAVAATAALIVGVFLWRQRPVAAA